MAQKIGTETLYEFDEGGAPLFDEYEEEFDEGGAPLFDEYEEEGAQPFYIENDVIYDLEDLSPTDAQLFMDYKTGKADVKPDALKDLLQQVGEPLSIVEILHKYKQNNKAPGASTTSNVGQATELLSTGADKAKNKRF